MVLIFCPRSPSGWPVPTGPCLASRRLRFCEATTQEPQQGGVAVLVQVSKSLGSALLCPAGEPPGDMLSVIGPPCSLNSCDCSVCSPWT